MKTSNSVIQQWQKIWRSTAWFERLWLLAPIAVWFSYQPFLRLGQNETMYFEVSIAMLYLVILATFGVSHIWRARKVLVHSRATLLTGAYVIWAACSLLWTMNPLRGALTVGVTSLLLVIFLASLVRKSQLQKVLPYLVRLFITSAVLMSILAIGQLIAGIWFDRTVTLLCAGCTATQFGFARPNVFAIEPQFFGSLLLAPLLITLHMLLTRTWRHRDIVCCMLIITALFLTLSRGAIFAFGLGVMVLVLLHRNNIRYLMGVGVLCLSAFIVSLVLQGVAAMANPSVDETFGGAISKTINQLSLGTITIPVASQVPATTKSSPAFDGYVEESTDARIGRSHLALMAWSKTWQTMLFGVGSGSSGIAMHQVAPGQIGTREIVQNQYVETLLEYGVVGLLMSTTILLGVFIGVRAQKERWLWALLVAFLLQWCFFSGYPNALHIYLVLIILYLYGLLRTTASKHLPDSVH